MTSRFRTKSRGFSTVVPVPTPEEKEVGNWRLCVVNSSHGKFQSPWLLLKMQGYHTNKFFVLYCACKNRNVMIFSGNFKNIKYIIARICCSYSKYFTI